MRTCNPSGFPNVWLYLPLPIDMVGQLESIVNSSYPTSATPGLSYREEINLLGSALTVLTQTRIPPGSIT